VTDNRRVVERAIQAFRERDFEAGADLIHSEITLKYPQSGEVLHGRDNYLAMLANYPGLPETEVAEPRGGDQQVRVVTPLPFSVPTVTIIGSGDTFTVESVNTYPDGSIYHGVSIMKIQDAKIIEEIAYFAAPFDPPDWRRPYLSS
jgi:hypothetical protein